MKMFWNRKLSTEGGNAAVVHILRAATIAAVVSSCSTSSPRSSAVLAQAEEPPPPPLVMLLDPASELAAAIKNDALKAYQDLSPEERSAHPIKELQSVFVTISYIDENSQESLLLLAPTLPDPNNTRKEVNKAAFRIPVESGGPGNFTDVHGKTIVTLIESPATTFSCGALSPAGTRYCDF